MFSGTCIVGFGYLNIIKGEKQSETNINKPKSSLFFSCSFIIHFTWFRLVHLHCWGLSVFSSSLSLIIIEIVMAEV